MEALERAAIEGLAAMADEVATRTVQELSRTGAPADDVSDDALTDCAMDVQSDMGLSPDVLHEDVALYIHFVALKKARETLSQRRGR